MACPDKLLFLLDAALHIDNLAKATINLDVIDSLAKANINFDVIDNLAKATINLDVIDNLAEATINLDVIDNLAKATINLDVIDNLAKATVNLNVVDNIAKFGTKEYLVNGMLESYVRANDIVQKRLIDFMDNIGQINPNYFNKLKLLPQIKHTISLENLIKYVDFLGPGLEKRFVMSISEDNVSWISAQNLFDYLLFLGEPSNRNLAPEEIKEIKNFVINLIKNSGFLTS